jgi:ribosomal protein S12 methylthiotransferase
MTKNKSPRVGFVSLGCPKALVDSERILTQLRAQGYEVAPEYDQADLVIVNTCGFIESAVNESLDAIGEALAENGKVIVTGCLGAKKEVILDKHPNVLSVTGPQAYEDVMRAVHQHLPPSHDPFTSLVPPQGVKLTPRHYAYLKISEGCNHGCTFCIIPSLRGKLKSRTLDEVMREADKLKQAGVKELLIISQDTSAYGLDLGKVQFQALCQRMKELDIWVRLHYVYPYKHVDEVIPLMAEGNLLPYLDIPFQHASSRILKLMKRPASSENNLERIKAWRTICPDLTIRSTFIVGFPGETEAEFEELLAFLEAAELDRVGCFQYSPVEGAKANLLPDPVADEIKEERYHRFMATQAKISARRLQAKVGKTMRVLIDEIRDEDMVARSSADAPEIDGLVFISRSASAPLKPGQFVDVKIIGADEYDLFAECV